MRAAVHLLLLAGASGAAPAEWFDLSEEFNLTAPGRRRLADAMNPPHRFICWFRHDLRLHDNPMIVEAASFAGDKEVLPVYIFDPRYFQTTEWGSFRTGVFRSRFLVESVMALREQLKELLSGLLVGIGRPEDLLPKLVARENLLDLGFSSKMVKNIGDAQLKATTIMWQEQLTPEELDIDERVAFSMPKGMNVKPVWGGTLYGRDALPYRKDFSNFPDTFEQFKSQIDEGIYDWKSQADEAYPAPVEGTLALPPRSQILIPDETPLGFKIMPQLQSGLATEGGTKKDLYNKMFKGGERVALSRIQKYNGGCEKSTVAKGYAKAKKGAKKEKSPAPTLAPWLAQLPPGMLSTKLSPWLASGCLSPRMVGHYLVENQLADQPIAAAVTHELLMRDFYRFSCAKHSEKLFDFQKAKGDAETEHLIRETTPEEDNLFNRWKDGRTGVPLIDAIMRELAATGWISQRARLNAASYLVDQLGVHWRRGGDYFESLLIDYDICSNWGNWALAAGVTAGKVPPLDPSVEAKEYDPEGVYIKHWVKELKRVPANLLHEWWTLPAEAMAQYGLKPGEGKDEYPLPAALKLRSMRSLAQLQLEGGSLLAQGSALAERHVPAVSAAPRRGLQGGAAIGVAGIFAADGEWPSFAVTEQSCAIAEGQTRLAVAEATAAEASEAWLQEWTQRLEAWWVATPYRDGLQACMGSLGLHLTSRFEAALRFLRMGTAAVAAPPPAMASATADGCEPFRQGAASLQLPDFPDMPAQFELPGVVPIPRLLPSLEHLQSLVEGTHRPHLAMEAAPQQLTFGSAALWVPVGSGAGAGLVAIGTAMAFLACTDQARKGRLSMRRKTTQSDGLETSGRSCQSDKSEKSSHTEAVSDLSSGWGDFSPPGLFSQRSTNSWRSPSASTLQSPGSGTSISSATPLKNGVQLVRVPSE